MSYDFSGYKRGLVRDLERMGLAHVNGHLVNIETGQDQHHFETRQDRLEAWLRDALLFAIEEYEQGRDVFAFRGLLQAAGYSAECGHSSLTSDAFITLRNAIEDIVRVGGELASVLDDALEEQGRPKRHADLRRRYR